jgi:ABC-type glutathione transport system ATPase component
MLERRPRSPEYPPGGANSLPDITVQEGAIEFRDVVFSYPGSNRTALNGISFSVAKNTKVALIGDSGAGKSTVLQLIARFYDPQNGQILLDGQDIKTHNVKSIRSNIAMVRQGADLFSTTILENIAYGRGDPSADEDNVALMEETIEAINSGQASRTSKRIVDGVMLAVDQAHATDFVRGKLTMTLGENGKGLSGGQKQRVTIARALFKDPKILLLDEVTSALDQVSEAVVQRAIDRLTANRTVFIVAHRLHTIQNADKILLLGGGKILAEGTHDELMATSERYREMIAAAKRDEEMKHKDTRSSRAVALLREIYDYISPISDMKPLGVKISEILSQVEEQDRKVRASHDALAASSSAVASPAVAGRGDASRAMVAAPSSSSKSSVGGDIFLLHDDDDDDDDSRPTATGRPGDAPPKRQPPPSTAMMSTSPVDPQAAAGAFTSDDDVTELSTLPMNISERPAPPIPSDDEDETF